MTAILETISEKMNRLAYQYYETDRTQYAKRMIKVRFGELLHLADDIFHCSRMEWMSKLDENSKNLYHHILAYG